jgi:hypothetical protein
LFSYTARSFERAGWTKLPSQSDQVHMLSSDGFLQPARFLEIYGRFALSERAATSDGNAQIATLTYLAQGRTQLRLNRYLDLAGEFRYLSQPVTNTTRKVAGVELGGWALRDLRAALGYNFNSAAEMGPNFLTRDVRKGFYFTLTSKISRLFDLFGTPQAGLGYTDSSHPPDATSGPNK